MEIKSISILQRFCRGSVRLSEKAASAVARIASRHRLTEGRHLPLKSWISGNSYALMNASSGSLVSIKFKTTGFDGLIKLDIFHGQKLAGAAIVRSDNRCITMFDIRFTETGNGIGKTFFKWLSLQAKSENKPVLICWVQNAAIVHLAYKHLDRIEVELAGQSLPLNEEQATRLYEEESIKDPDIKRAMFIEGWPKA